MNPIRWIRWRLRSPMSGNDEVASVGASMGWNLRVAVERDGRDFGTLARQWRQAQWLAWVWDTALFEGTAGLMTDVRPNILTRLGSGFYVAVRRELQADFGPASREERDFNKAVDELVFMLDLGRADLSLGTLIGTAGVWHISQGVRGTLDLQVSVAIANRAVAQISSKSQAIRELAANPK